MMAFDTELARFNMIEQQIRPWDVLDKRVLATLAHIPREQFVAPEQRHLAFSDIALPIGQQETLLPPVVEGRLLQAANPQPTERVLEIGTGSGFFTACLAHLARSVVSVDIHAEFTARAGERLAELGIDRVLLETGDAAKGWAPSERFDVIVLTGAVAELPDAFRQQLNIGGRLIAIVGHEPILSAVRITRQGEADFTHEALFETHTRYLRGAAPQPVFQFN